MAKGRNTTDLSVFSVYIGGGRHIRNQDKYIYLKGYGVFQTWLFITKLN